MRIQSVLETLRCVHGSDRLWKAVLNFRTANRQRSISKLVSGAWNHVFRTGWRWNVHADKPDHCWQMRHILLGKKGRDCYEPWTLAPSVPGGHGQRPSVTCTAAFCMIFKGLILNKEAAHKERHCSSRVN